MIWYLGDSVFSEEVAKLSDDVVDSSVPNAIMEHVWTEQTKDSRMQGRKDPCIVILFVNNQNYDSEVLIWNILNVVHPDSIVALVVSPPDALAREGMTAHYVGPRFRLVPLAYVHPPEFAQRIREVVNELS